MALKHGDSGNNTISGNYGEADTLYGNLGSDNISGLDKNDIIFGGRGIADSQDGNDTLYGGDGQDSIYGNGGDDWIYGGLGNDTIYGGADSNIIFGGNGIADPLDGDDVIYAGNHNNLVYANGGDDYISSGNGDDTIYGGAGRDLIESGEGNNYLTGGAGNDIFSISYHNMEFGERDVITDFTKGQDLIELELPGVWAKSEVRITDIPVGNTHMIGGTMITYTRPLQADEYIAGGPFVINLFLENVHGITLSDFIFLI